MVFRFLSTPHNSEHFVAWEYFATDLGVEWQKIGEDSVNRCENRSEHAIDKIKWNKLALADLVSRLRFFL